METTTRHRDRADWPAKGGAADGGRGALVDPTDLDLGHARTVAVQVAEEAGALLRRHATEAFTVHEKGKNGDLVTELDLAAERQILARLRKAFPEHAILAEEGGEERGRGQWMWLVDPLDGTNNLAIGLNVYAVGLALLESGRPVVTAIHDVPAKMTWSAIRGRGAFGPDDGRIRPGRSRGLRRLNLGWVQGHEVGDDHRAKEARTLLEGVSKRVLSLWAPLVSWVMLARGDLDGMVVFRSQAVDLQAGVLLARESGVEVVSPDGSAFDDHFVSARHPYTLIAARPPVTEELRTLLAPVLDSARPPRRAAAQGPPRR
jgi:myo-inositol-1(or 4)-monophosphatase